MLLSENKITSINNNYNTKMIANSKQNRKKTQNKKMQKTRFLKE